LEAIMSEGRGAVPAGTAEAKTKAALYQRPGLTAITPYIIVRPATKFIEFLKNAFGGTEQLRMPAPDGSIMHAEVAVGNGAIELSDGNAQYPPAPADIHIYVNDADATFAKALKAGATSIFAPTDEHPSGDRWGAAKDQFGNNWYIATPKWTPGPEGIPTIQPYLHLREAHNIIPFLETVFGAEVLGIHKSPEGVVHHATIRIGNATLEIDEAHDEFQPKPCHLHVYVPDTDAAYARALRTGATSVEEPQDKPYGDRSAGVKDAWGNSWFIANYLGK
jgi:PhnB protein